MSVSGEYQSDSKRGVPHEMPHLNEGNGNAPALSMILVVGGQRQRATRALRSLLEQSAIDQMEILLFDLGPEESPPLPGSDHRRVKLARSDPNDSLTAARVRGIRAAKAPVVGFLEEHAEMQPGWASTVIADHREPWAAVGTDFINGNPDAGLSNKCFRMNYGYYVRPPGPRGPTRLVAGQNSSFKRDVLLRYESDLELLLNADLILQRKMQADGHRLFYDPSVHIAHRNENTFRSLAAGAFYWNWCYSNVRAQINKWGPLRKLIWIALSPLIPWVRLFRLVRQQLSKACVPWRQFFADIPFIIGISYCSAAGQVFGLLNPGEPAFRKFSHFEMNEPRLLSTEFAK